MLNTTHQEIVSLMPAMRRVVASVLRTSRYNSEDHVEECLADIMLQALDYGARTFDASKGSAKSHFTTFAARRAKNWLHVACRRFEVADEVTTSEGEVVSHSASVPAEGNPLLSLSSSRDKARLVAALEALDGTQRALVEAYVRHGSWLHAARELGMSPVQACRMKKQIVAQLQADDE